MRYIYFRERMVLLSLFECCDGTPVDQVGATSDLRFSWAAKDVYKSAVCIFISSLARYLDVVGEDFQFFLGPRPDVLDPQPVFILPVMLPVPRLLYPPNPSTLPPR